MIDPDQDIMIVWGRCPYPDELCGAEATLSNIQFPDDEIAWSAELHCANGHQFGIAYSGDRNP